MVFVGIVFPSRSVTKAMPIESRLQHHVLNFTFACVMIAIVYYYAVVVNTVSVGRFLSVGTVGLVAWLTVYKVTRHLLRRRPATPDAISMTNSEV